MKFAEIIREAGFSPEAFPNASNISVTLYDRKDRIVPYKTIHFVENLFANNLKCYNQFSTFLNEVENSYTHSMNIRIDEYAVYTFYKSANARVFFRTLDEW